MKALRRAIREIWGLFVEDATFTLGMIASLVVASFALPHLPIAPTWKGAILFLMLAAVLVENVTRTARK